jgi:hypothetical protein
MVRKDHIEKMNLIGEMLGSAGEGLAIVTINAGVEYAKRLATDEALRAQIAATFNPSLAARDFRRARKVVEKYSYRPLKPSRNAASRPSVKVAPPKYNREVLLAHGIVGLFGTRYEYTAKGQAWKDAGKPDLGTWTPPKAPEQSPPIGSKPDPVSMSTIAPSKELLMRVVPYEQTEAGYIDLENYWREFKHEPPDGFDLSAWAHGTP